MESRLASDSCVLSDDLEHSVTKLGIQACAALLLRQQDLNPELSAFPASALSRAPALALAPSLNFHISSHSSVWTAPLGSFLGCCALLFWPLLNEGGLFAQPNKSLTITTFCIFIIYVSFPFYSYFLASWWLVWDAITLCSQDWPGTLDFPASDPINTEITNVHHYTWPVHFLFSSHFHQNGCLNKIHQPFS